MKVGVALAGLLLAGLMSGCSDRYSENDLQLLTSYRAKELCSCLFAMEQSEDYCVRWTVAAPNLASFKIDKDKKTVETAALFDWSMKARWVDARRGCILE